MRILSKHFAVDIDQARITYVIRGSHGCAKHFMGPNMGRRVANRQWERNEYHECACPGDCCGCITRKCVTATRLAKRLWMIEIFKAFNY